MQTIRKGGKLLRREYASWERCQIIQRNFVRIKIIIFEIFVFTSTLLEDHQVICGSYMHDN